MALSDTADLCIVRQRIYYKKWGWTEGFHYIPPAGGSMSARIRAGVPDVLNVCKHRANLFPDGVYMGYCHISHLNSGRDSKQILGSTLYGITTAGAYRYDKSNDGSSSIEFKFSSNEGNTISYWLSGVPDQWLVDANLVVSGGSGNIGIQTNPGALKVPALGNNSNTDVTLIQKWLQAYMAISCFGRKTKKTSPPQPFEYDGWDEGYYNAVSRRKHGTGWKSPVGRASVGY